MLINHDFSRRVTVTPEDHGWVPSPQRGVDRVMLDRIGGEQARATSFVRYLPDTAFPLHAHPGGEEILVLAGQFSEGERHYPAGWYLRNPPGSCHQPHSTNGTLLFVKLGQMRRQERVQLRVNTRDAENWLTREGMQVCPLFSDAHERVCLLRLSVGTVLAEPGLPGGAEVLIVEGSLIEGNSIHPQGSWLRIAPQQRLALMAGSDNTVLYLKKGHLAAAPQEPCL
ncbi:cupin domain-containing protein [Kosakonia sp.]|uniref:cupin domain-containing protein n=1 Tax=Kosakonia sp. TaxID=1916651 RepID=UPI0028A0AC8C|nr:cupin domain-containing protein [Kosakonia sp.]